VLNYGNATALALWEMNFEHLTSMPSRLIAEPDQREERARLLQRTTLVGFIEDYQGVRVTKSGRRFHVQHAAVWNLLDETEQLAGQAATYREYEMLP
jgi:hypothetical protein